MVERLGKLYIRKYNMIFLCVMMCSIIGIFFINGINISHTKLVLAMTFLSVSYGIRFFESEQQRQDKKISKIHRSLFMGMACMFLFLVWSFARTWENTTPYFANVIGRLYSHLFLVLILLCLCVSIILFIKNEKTSTSFMLLPHLFGMMATFVVCQHQLSQMSIGTMNLQFVVISQIVDFIPYIVSVSIIMMCKKRSK